MDEMPTVVEAASLIRSKQLSSLELVAESLRRIDRTEPALNAWAHVDADGALRAAADVDDAIARGEPVGPLAGVPFGVKDLEDCVGMPTTKASRWYAAAPPATRDDFHVARFRAAGAVPIGKTTTPEFGAWGFTASPLLGVTRNPWNTERTPGGSSGGTSATVSAGVVPFGTASDGGGSIRGPGASVGLPGLKPVYGRVPTWGVTRHAQNAVNFALATTVTDTAFLFDIAVGPDPRDRTSLPHPGISYVDVIEQLDVGGLRAAWSADLGFVTVDPEVVSITSKAAEALIDVAQLSPTDGRVRSSMTTSQFTDSWKRPTCSLTCRLIGPSASTNSTNRLLPAGDAIARSPLLKFARVERQRRELEQRVAAIFDDTDVLLTPTNACPPFGAEGPMPSEIGGVSCHQGTAALLTMLANICNLPAVTVPAGLTADGLPVGLMITARQHREDICLRLARIFEQTKPWPRHSPGW